MKRQYPKPAVAIALVALALIVRGLVLLGMPGALVDDPDAYHRLAENLIEHGTFGQGTTPTAFRPPLYPLLLTPAVALGDSSRMAIGFLHLALGTVTVWLVYRVGLCWGLGKWAFLAALLVACDPILLSQSALVMTETLAALMAVGALWWLTAVAKHPSAARAAVAGSWIALASLCRPTFLVFLALAALVLLMVVPGRIRRLKICAAFAVGAVVVLTPWIVRNQVRMGRPIVATTHGGYTLLLGNNPWFYDYLRSGDWGTIWNADAFAEHWNEQLAQAGPHDELAADRLAYAEARRAIRDEPGMFLHACVVRVGRLWAVMPHQLSATEGPKRRALRYGVAAWYVVELGLAALGLIVLWRGEVGQETRAKRRADSQRDGAFSRWGHSWLWGVVLVVSFMGIHTFYWTNMRMRGPLMPVVALAAAAGVTWLASRANCRNSCENNTLEC